MLTVAICGAGGLGRNHAENYAAIPGAEVALVFDVVAEAAAALAEDIGARATTDEADLWADGIDAVVITTPTPFHADYTIKAARAGKHLFLEKAMATTLDDARAVRDAVGESGVRSVVSFVLRWNPLFETAKALIADDAPDGVSAEVFGVMHEADSIVVDPHKHGLQPYGCGCILFRDPTVGTLYKHDSPYTYFSSSELHLGEISLECSRAGASAVALWATQRLLPMIRGGEFAQGLAQCRDAALSLHRHLSHDERFLTMFEPELDIVIFAPRAATSTEVTRLSRALFDSAAALDLHLALFSYPATLLATTWPGVTMDSETVACMRSCLMKPEHLEWSDEIRRLLERALDAAVHKGN